MDVFKVETRRIFLVFAKLTLIISSVLVLVSANCPDPGTLKNGYFIASHVNRGYIDGTVIYFYCNVNYKLIGAKKIICSKGKWNGKTPICQSQGCPLPPPSFPYAHVTSNPVSNTKGSYVSYACDLGYTSHGRPTRLLCDKDAKTQGYKWSGNITCQKVTCGPPPGPTGGHGNVTVTSSGTTTYAHYRCFPGYILLDYRPGLVDDTFTTVCSNSGVWKNIPSCVKTCNSTDIEFDHGNVKSYYPRYMGTQTHNFFYTQDVEVTFTCTERYKLQGYPKRTCTRSGQWSGTNPRCVPSSCGSPGPIPNGQGMSNNSNSQPSHFPIWTVVTFSCNAGYELEGPSQRQCQTNGQWTQRHNPTCQKSSVTCKPRHLNYGGYTPPKPSYKLNELIHAFCKDTYYLYGELKLKCSSLPGQKGVWIPTTCPMSEVCTSKCLTAEEYGEKCKKLGQHSKILKPGVIICEENDEETPTAAKRSDSELDKMTIVVATAGSTLGALVVLLTALVCFRRFNRSRRFRRYSFRSRRYSDDDRIAIIAAYTGDVHFILPSYDEAMSQVERSPPPFEAVVEETSNSNNQSATNTNNVSATQAANAGTATENTNSSEQVGASPESLNTRAQDPTIAEERPIHIVSNPLHDSSHDTESHAQSGTVQNDIVNEGGSNFSVNFADESIDNGDEELSPNQQPESLPSSSSEDDLSSSQTQPLLGNARRGVMV